MKKVEVFKGALKVYASRWKLAGEFTNLLREFPGFRS